MNIRSTAVGCRIVAVHRSNLRRFPVIPVSNSAYRISNPSNHFSTLPQHNTLIAVRSRKNYTEFMSHVTTTRSNPVPIWLVLMLVFGFVVVAGSGFCTGRQRLPSLVRSSLPTHLASEISVTYKIGIMCPIRLGQFVTQKLRSIFRTRHRLQAQIDGMQLGSTKAFNWISRLAKRHFLLTASTSETKKGKTGKSGRKPMQSEPPSFGPPFRNLLFIERTLPFRTYSTKPRLPVRTKNSTGS